MTSLASLWILMSAERLVGKSWRISAEIAFGISAGYRELGRRQAVHPSLSDGWRSTKAMSGALRSGAALSPAESRWQAKTASSRRRLLESLRMVLSCAVSAFPCEPKKVLDPTSPDRTQVLLIDISRACFNSVISDEDPTCVEVPPEFGAAPGTCALPRRHTYSTRKAADGWQRECSATLRSIGFL